MDDLRDVIAEEPRALQKGFEERPGDEAEDGAGHGAGLLQGRGDLLDAVGRLWAAYAAHVDWEDRDALEARICRLLPALMLARVDGKSPVEYLEPQTQATVRRIARDLVASPGTTIDNVLARIAG